MLNTFRIVSLVEGISFLILLFVAMPLKHYYGYPEAVSIMGWTHGLLFMAFVVLAMNVSQRQGWSNGFLLLVMFAGVAPFGCFFLEKRLKREVAVASELS